MFYAIFDKDGILVSTASEIDEKVIEENKLTYKTFEGDDGDWPDYKDWDTKTKDFVDKPPLPIGKTKQERVDEIVRELGLTPEQKEKLENVI